MPLDPLALLPRHRVDLRRAVLHKRLFLRREPQPLQRWLVHETIPPPPQPRAPQGERTVQRVVCGTRRGKTRAVPERSGVMTVSGVRCQRGGEAVKR